MKVKVLVTPKAAVLDPQGAAIEVDDKTPNLDSRLNDLCRDLLSNPVIEDYEVVKS
ncbi:MAG: hypothetical protein DME70_03245 [Verrucomicrobia bacterium]|nr:MAG: hypothetical protein DME70_03245 [Verrucomicrobiota bacterium]